jgi:hypothetical protein
MINKYSILNDSFLLSMSVIHVLELLLSTHKRERDLLEREREKKNVKCVKPAK